MEIELELRKRYIVLTFCSRSSCTLVVISLFLSYNMDTGGGLDEIQEQDFSC